MKKMAIKNLLLSANFAIFIGCLLIASLYFTVTSFLQSSKQGQTTLENTFQQKTEFSYLANVQTSLLYPEGGLVKPDTVIFENVTKEISATIRTSLKSEKLIRFEGTYQPMLTIEAGEYWKKQIPLDEKHPLKFEGTEDNIIDQTYTINVSDIKQLIKSVEAEINVSPDVYLLKVTPNMTGTIHYKGTETPLDGGGELVFEYGYNKIRLVSEKEFITEVPFENHSTIENPYNLFFLAAPAILVRIVSTICSVFLFFLLLYQMKCIRKGKLDMLTVAQIIDHKYSKRLITVTKKIDVSNRSFLTLESFTALTQLADEKELPILRYEDKSKQNIVYFIMDFHNIYSFEASNRVEDKGHLPVGSDISYG